MSALHIAAIVGALAIIALCGAALEGLRRHYGAQITAALEGEPAPNKDKRP